ncbi:uncharacterized protein METZ01_LOCUS290833, partial [marine metagenome]
MQEHSGHVIAAKSLYSEATKANDCPSRRSLRWTGNYWRLPHRDRVF